MKAGTELTPTIKLVRKLGQGGMGSVWIADHKALHTEVAVKLMSEGTTTDEASVARFASEASAAAKIRSPHVVQVFDHGVADGNPYIVMELLQGEDLQATLTRRGTLTLVETVHIVRQSCKALAQAHSLGIVHRDIKPANIFLTDVLGEVFVKVLDFGLAKLERPAKAQTKTGAIFGTLEYMSPEQTDSSRNVSPASDLWSLGVVTYQCLTGSLPFAAESLLEMCVAINEARFVPASEARKGLSPSLDGWFERALDPDPEARFSSAMEMADALAAAVEGSMAPTILASRATMPRAKSARREKPRNRALLIAAAAPVLLGLGYVGYRATRTPAAQETHVARIVPAVDSMPASSPVTSAVVQAPPAPLASIDTPPRATSAPIAVIPPPRATVVSAPPPAPIDASSSGGSGPPKATRAQVAMARANDLYEQGVFTQKIGALAGAVSRCMDDPAVAMQMSASYVIRVAGNGAITDVYQVPGATRTLDACMIPILKTLRLGPTLTGKPGDLNVAFRPVKQ